MEIKKVGIVAMTGTMGTGIAQVCAQAGFQVLGSSRSQENLNKAVASIDSQLTRGIEKGRVTQEQKKAALSLIKTTTNMKDFGDCDLVIEAAIEDLNLKKGIFTELDKICPKNTIIATNTSCLSIMELAMMTTRVDKVVGVHFFNPVPVMKLLEIVRTLATSDDTAKSIENFGKAVGKTTVIAQDYPGFIVNRLMIPFLLHAVRMYESKVATREDIDTAINLGLNHPMGPLALCDLIGLDVVEFIAKGVYEVTKDPQFITPVLVQKMISAGWLGRKTRKGFYDYK